MEPLVRYRRDFRWEGVPVQDYKGEDAPFRDVTRQVLFGPEARLACELRYFEIHPGGHTTLEKHEHAHAVVILQGTGRVLVGSGVFDVEPFDLIHVPSLTLHQFRAAGESPLGFLCLVDRERDRPVLPTEEELAALRADPESAAFLRA